MTAATGPNRTVSPRTSKRLTGARSDRVRPTIPWGRAMATRIRARPVTSSWYLPSTTVKTSPLGTSSPPTSAPDTDAIPPR